MKTQANSTAGRVIPLGTISPRESMRLVGNLCPGLKAIAYEHANSSSSKAAIAGCVRSSFRMPASTLRTPDQSCHGKSRSPLPAERKRSTKLRGIISRCFSLFTDVLWPFEMDARSMAAILSEERKIAVLRRHSDFSDPKNRSK